MPAALATALVPLLSSAFLAIGLPGLAFGATVGLIATGASYLLLAGAAYLIGQAFQPAKPEAPKPEDGKFNLKQSVPPLVYVLGKVKKAGDYVFLEETGGTAYHITVWAAHHIKGFTQHWLHDEAATLDGSGNVTVPAHFEARVNLQTRRGDAVSTAYAHIVAAFPSIWTSNHRGDGLATVAMAVQSIAAEYLQKLFPSGMPQHQAEGEGHDQLIDPRTGVTGYSTNLAIFRYWHLSHPVGGKLTTDDLYTPDWANAANVCDQTVTNRSGGSESRYHGGLWFRANNDPVQIGRLMDQAAEMVLYERPDGKVGVHAGAFVTPDVRLTADDIVSISYDPNKRRSTNVLAVRGRYTDPAKGYNTTDAAIYGIPYPSDDERTKTVENQAVQSHNHMARLQAIAFIRANAPRVKILAHYEPARNVPYRRFVTIHYPPKMTEAVVELTGRPVLSLRNLTYEFEGIVIPGALLYAFDAATQEGAPGSNVVPVERQDVPEPLDFVASIQTEAVGGGSTAAFARANFTFQNSTFQYEFQWVPTAGGTAQSVMGEAGATTVRTGYLADGTEYKFRARTWSVGTASEWTAYQTLTATADPVSPGALSATSVTGASGFATAGFTTPASGNIKKVAIYRVPAGGVLNRTTHLVTKRDVLIGNTYSYVDGDSSVTNLLSDPGFATGTGWTFNTGWSRNAGTNRADHASASETGVTQAFTYVAGSYRYGFSVAAQSVAGTGIFARFAGGTAVSDTPQSGVGAHFGTMTPLSGNNSFAFRASTWVGSIDDVVLFKDTGLTAPQGAWDYYLEPQNASNLAGTLAGPFTVTII